MGDTVNIRLTAEDKIHLQQRMDETGKSKTEVFKSAIYFTEIDREKNILKKGITVTFTIQAMHLKLTKTKCLRKQIARESLEMK